MKKLLPFSLLLLGLAGCNLLHVAAASAGLNRPPYDPTIAAKEVTWNEARVRRDPGGAIGWSQLSAAYLTLARQTDDNSMAAKAEMAARKSLSIRRRNNVNAALRLAKAILEQHRFREALSATDDAMRIDPHNSSAHELHTEILVELGRYDQAWKEYDKYDLAGTGLSGMALKAKLLQIDGKTADAASILAQAAYKADQNWDVSREADAWFHLAYGKTLSDEGKTDEAVAEFNTAIEINPHDFKSMGSIARIKAAQGDLKGAKSWALKSIAITPSVEVASLLEDIADGEHNADDSAKYSTLVDEVSHPDMNKFLKDPSSVPSLKPHTHDRLYAVYCADHMKNLPDALSAAKKDMQSRQDIYAYDTMAWVLHQMGRDAEAKAYMAKALRRGTVDAKMFYHAGLIDAALGNVALARKELGEAVVVNPDFQYGQVAVAKSELTSLGDVKG
jgi:tetratricopeptide (TPR) repeat protein